MSGAGKTTVCDVFREKCFEIINCDIVARSVTEKGSACLEKLCTVFGNDILTADSELDRRKLGSIVFSDSEKLKKLNNLIYPYITYNVIKLIEKSENSIILLDAPTLFESGIDFICDGIISVVCDAEKSIQRIMQRDNITRQQAEERLSSQHSKEYYCSKSDYCIENNGTRQQLISAAEKTADSIIADCKPD